MRANKSVGKFFMADNWHNDAKLINRKHQQHDAFISMCEKSINAVNSTHAKL